MSGHLEIEARSALDIVVPSDRNATIEVVAAGHDRIHVGRHGAVVGCD